MMVALALGAIILTAGAAALLGAMSGVTFARENRQAADIFTDVVEEARAADYEDLAVAEDTAALAADTRLTQMAGEYYLDPDGTGPLAPERLVVAPDGAVTLRSSLLRENQTYTISSYVTEPAGADADYRRVVTYVSWVQPNGRAHTRQAATFVTGSEVGTEPPSANVGTDSAFTVNAGATLSLPVSVNNTGGPETWNLTTSAPGRAWSFTWYLDANANGVRDTDENTVMTDTNGDGVVDTGEMVTGPAKNLVGQVEVGSAEPGGVVSTVITATAASDSSVARSVTHQVTVVSQECPGCTYRVLYANNTANAPADSALQNRMRLLDAARPNVALPNYDTDKDPFAGRTLAPGSSSPTDSDFTKRAVWEMQLPTQTKLQGEVKVRLYVAMKDFNATKTGSLRVWIGHASSGNTGWTALNNVTTPALSFGTAFSYVEVKVPISTLTTISANRWLQVRVTAPSAQDSLWLAYGTATYPAAVHLPVVT